ncbi:MAG: hypothetical protein ACJ8R9_23080 [Steroidobacteraceae bacterium]
MKRVLLIATWVALFSAAVTMASATAPQAANSGRGSLTEKERAALTEAADALYDVANAGWGTEHKYIDVAAMEWSFAAVDSGNQLAMTKVRRTLDANQNLIDPVWGGVFQYSDQADWTSPHYEKLLSHQADNLRMYSEAYSRWHRKTDLEAAQKLYSYLTTFLSAPDGGFYVSQDADVSVQMTGKEFYAKDDAARRVVGMPKIDVHEYARETGWAVRALCKYYDVTRDTAALARAERGAKWALTARPIPGGGFSHDASRVTSEANRTAGPAQTDGALHARASTTRNASYGAEDTSPAGPFLDDNISMTQAFLALYRSTGNREWLKAAVATADFIDAKLRDTRAGYSASPSNLNTRGAFQQPIRDVAQNAAVVRTAGMLHHYTAAERHLRIARHAMKYLSSVAAAASDQFRPDILLADHELSMAPIHITIVGGKDDPAAQSLHAAALQYPTDYLQVDWWDRREGKLPDPSITYPDLKRPAAFACTANACSTPVYEGSQIQERVRSVLN